ncbi:MAG: hypothetical protein JSS66_18805 [Armatimonadetes bacterium]|nr:hypothetical protein [Armatimonadota bacterium]
MVGAYFEAVRAGLAGVLSLFLKLALPLGIFSGLSVAGWAIASSLRAGSPAIDWPVLKKWAAGILSYVGIGLLVVALWSGLKAVQPTARQAIEWKEGAGASDTPTNEAPQINQYGPVAAVMVDKTYRRSITLPPDFLARIGTDSVGALSPYLVDPTAENVKSLADNFRRNGQDVVFTREVVREDEQPVSFESSDVKVDFKRQAGQAYSVIFDATYTFKNTTGAPAKMRFMFGLPEGGGTVQDVKITCAGQDVAEPDNQGSAYKWSGEVPAGESRQAKVHYQSSGSRAWSYDMGSSRRRVRAFTLQSSVDGVYQFTKHSIPPSSRSGNKAEWRLNEVVTSQELALSFPPDIRGRDAFLQALGTLPATLVLFGLAILLAAGLLRAPVSPVQLAFGLLSFGVGLGATAVLANYVGPVVAVIAAPLAGASLAVSALGVRFALLLMVTALLPATSLSPQHTGLWVFAMIAVVLVNLRLLTRTSPTSDAGTK